MPGARAPLGTLVGTLAIALGAFGLAVAAPGKPRTGLRLSAAGALGLTSSRDGETLFSAAGMRPGQAVSGTLRITNAGDGSAVLAVRTSAVHEQAGTGGGRLSGRIALSISDVSSGQAPVELWTGLPKDLDEARLATLAPGASRDLVVTAALAAASAGNAYQGAALSLGLAWGAQRPAAGPMPTVSVTPSPATPVTPTLPAPPAAPVPPGDAPVDVGADELGLPGAARCLSRRRFAITLRAPGAAKVAQATVRVGRRAPTHVAGRGRRKVSARVDLRGFSQRKVTVKIDLRTSDGRRYRSQRQYRICAGR